MTTISRSQMPTKVPEHGGLSSTVISNLRTYSSAILIEKQAHTLGLSLQISAAQPSTVARRAEEHLIGKGQNTP